MLNIVSQTTQTAYTLAPGVYVIGDPCYMMPDDDHKTWNKLMDSSDSLENNPAQAGNFQVIALDTAYGDGILIDDSGMSYPVDSGTIGIALLSDVVDLCGHDKSFGCHIHEFKKEFLVREMDGVLYFGNVIIDTNGNDYGYDDDDYRYGEDDEE